MSAKHTPGKLIAETKQSDLETNDPRCSIGIVNGKILFTTTIVNAPNNAVRLCKCWNSHDALLEACKELLGDWWCARSSCQNPECRACQNAKADKLRYETIISQAEKEG